MFCTTGKWFGIMSSLKLQISYVCLVLTVAFVIQQTGKHEIRLLTQNCFTFCGHAGFSQGSMFLRHKYLTENKKSLESKKQYSQFLYWVLPCHLLHQVKARLGGRLRLLISGGAPLSTEIEEFLRVTTCAYFIQGYGNTFYSFLQHQNKVTDSMLKKEYLRLFSQCLLQRNGQRVEYNKRELNTFNAITCLCRAQVSFLLSQSYDMNHNFIFFTANTSFLNFCQLTV